MNPDHHLFQVEGMTCTHCEKAVIQAIKALDPDAKVTVDRSQSQVRVDSHQDHGNLAQAIVKEGYHVRI